jgi:hypothetical protein
MNRQVIKLHKLKRIKKPLHWLYFANKPVYEFSENPSLIVAEYNLIADKPLPKNQACILNVKKKKYIYFNVKMLLDYDFVMGELVLSDML